MAITITIDNDRVTGGIQSLIEDESLGVQTPLGTTTPASADTGNEIDVTLSGGVLGGFVTAFDDFLNNTGAHSISSLFSGLTLTGAQETFAAANDGASSSADFVKVTVSAGETINDLFFSDSAGNALNGDQVFLADGTTPMQTTAGDNIYLWSNGDFAIATTSSTAGAGTVVAAFYLNDSDPNHLQAQVQMVTFVPLKHPDGTNPDDSLTWTNLLQVTAAGSKSFDFNSLKSGDFLWVAVGDSSGAVLVTGGSPSVGSDNKITNTSDDIHVSQGGDGTTIGINNQLFDAANETGVFTLVKGLTTLPGGTNGAGGVYTVDPNTHDNKLEGIDYSDYLNVTGAGIYISQSQGTPSVGKNMEIKLLNAGAAIEDGTNYIPGLASDGTVNVGTVTIVDDDGNVVGVWGTGGLSSGTTISGHHSTNGTANITVTISGNTADVTGVLGNYTIDFTSASGTFNRFDLTWEGGKFDVGRVDILEAAGSTVGVGGNLVVQDDHPSITGSVSGAAPLVVDDTTLGTNDTKDYSGLFTPSYGTDGPGSTAVTYALSTPGGDCGLIESGTGLHVFLFKIGANIVGKSGTDSANALASGTTVFVVSVDGSGNVTLDQQRAVVHDPDSGTDQSTSLSSAGLVVLTATAHDGDGDTASTGLNIGTLLTFKDDAPTITQQIHDGEVLFAADGTGTVTNSLFGSVGGDINNSSHQSLSGVEQYTITYWTTPTDVYPDLNAVLSADGTTLTYYSDLTDLNAVYQLSLNQTANSGAGSYTFTVLQPPPITTTHFGFADLHSGQNLFGIIAVDKTNIVNGVLPDGGLLVMPNNPVLALNGTMTNTSGSICTSKGGGGVTIGNTNQAFDHPGEGAFFMYVDNPVTAATSGVGLTPTGANDADTIRFDGVNQATDASVEIVQASGKGTIKSPGPAIHIVTYEVAPGTIDTDPKAESLVKDPTAGGSQVNIIEVIIKNAAGTVIEDRTNAETGADNGGNLANGSLDSLVGITFHLDNDGGTPLDHTDDTYSVNVSNLALNYTVEFKTATQHDLALVENVSGSYDLGGFDLINKVNVPAQNFDFAVQISDYDNDVYGGHSIAVANFGVTIDALNFV